MFKKAAKSKKSLISTLLTAIFGVVIGSAVIGVVAPPTANAQFGFCEEQKCIYGMDPFTWEERAICEEWSHTTGCDLNSGGWDCVTYECPEV